MPPIPHALAAAIAVAAMALHMPVHAQRDVTLPRLDAIGAFETVAAFDGDPPAGIAVAADGRLFVTFPRYDGPVAFTLAEVRDGRAVAYPSAAINAATPATAAERLVSVQNAVIDRRGRLWALDSGFFKLGDAVAPGGPKLVAIDLADGTIVRTVGFDAATVTPTSFLNDLRIDLDRGADGTAYVTDASFAGANAIVVVDLASGRALRRLAGHPTVLAEPGLRPIVDGRFIESRDEKTGARKPLSGGVNGIALAAGKRRVVYSALTGRHLYKVDAAALADPSQSDADIALTIEDLGEKGTSGGIESDADGRVYLTNAEHNAVFRRAPDGRIETLASDPRLLWPDTMTLADDGWLYLTLAQFNRRAPFRDGVDERVRPFAIVRLRAGARPVR